MEAGAELRVVDGRGRARWGKVTRVDRTTAAVSLGDPAPDNEPSLRLALLVPTCRPEAAAWLVEKGTEVGVSAVHFLNMARAPRDFGTGTLDRLRRVAAAAVEQCHRSRLPEITGPHAWKETGRLAGAGPRWFLDTEADSPPPQGGHAGPPLQPAGTAGALLVGPEGGLAPEERAGASGGRLASGQPRRAHSPAGDGGRGGSRLPPAAQIDPIGGFGLA